MNVRNSTLTRSAALVLACGTVAAHGQIGEPPVDLTAPDGSPLIDPFDKTAGSFLAPGTGPLVGNVGWPGSTVAGANYFFTALDLTTGNTNVFSDFGIVDSTQGGPIGFSVSRHNNGDLDITFGIAAPNNPLSYANDPLYEDFDLDLDFELNGQTLDGNGPGDGEIRTGGGSLSLNTGGLPTYGWKPHVSQGVLLVQPIANGVAPFENAERQPGAAPEGPYDSLVLGTDGLRHYWRFEDATDPSGSLTTVADVAGGEDGVVVGVVESEPGLVGNAGLFIGDTDPDANNNIVEIPGSDFNSDFDLQGSFTIEALIRIDSFPRSFQGIISKGDNSWRMSPDGTNPFFEPSANGLAGSTTNNIRPIGDGQWHYVAFVVDQDAGTQFAYVDDTVVGETFPSGSNVDLSDFLVLIGGNAQRTDREWEGNIDELAIYDVALTPQQIQERVDLLGTAGGSDSQDVFGIINAVANSADRTGVGFSMIDGRFGDARSSQKPDSIRIQISAHGNLGEASLPFAVAWFPYEQGWIGGYHTPKGIEYRQSPVFFSDTARDTGAATDPADIASLFVLPEQETIAGRTIQWKQDEASGITEILGITQDNYPTELGLGSFSRTNDFALLFEGTVTIPETDDYFFGLEVDDAGEIDVLVDGQWVNVVNRRNTGGCSLFEGAITLDAGTYPVRIKYLQRGGGGCLSAFLDSPLTFGEPLTFDGPGATVKLYDLDRLDARSGDYQGLVDVDSDGNIDYGLGSWRVEGIARASVTRSLLDHADAVKYLPDPNGSGDNGLHGRVRFDLPGITPDDGMLFVQGTESSSSPVWTGLLPPQPGDSSWEAHLRRSNTSQVDDSGDTVQIVSGPDSITGLGSGMIGFVHVPWDAADLVGGYVLPDGTVRRGEGQFQINKTATGTYALTVPGKTGADGMVLIQPVGISRLDPAFATRALISYEYDSNAGVFEIQARDWQPGDNGSGAFDPTQNTYPLVDSGFYFVWVDFEAPLSLDPVCAADLTGPNGEPDGVLDANDFFEYLNLFSSGDQAADLTGPSGTPDGIIDANDFFEYLSLFAAGCP